MQSPPEKHAFVAALNPPGSKLNDALLVIDVDPGSSSYGQRVGQVAMPKFGDELHHFGWNACSSALCPYSPHPHVERRYLVVPGLRSSRIHIIDTKPDPRKPQIVKVIEPETLAARDTVLRLVGDAQGLLLTILSLVRHRLDIDLHDVPEALRGNFHSFNAAAPLATRTVPISVCRSGSHGNCASAGGEARENAAAVVIAIRKLTSGFVIAQ